MDKSKSPELLFVYNADSGVANQLIDYGKKYIAPSKFDCQLCMVSYGAFGMKRDWKKFIGLLPFRTVFLHRDEFEKTYPNNKFSYPAVIQKYGSKMKLLITSQDFDSIKDLETLRYTLNQKLGIKQS